MGEPNPRFRHDNILVNHLEMPERQTQDWEVDPVTGSVKYDPKVEKFLSLTFANEDFESVTTLGPGGGNGGGRGGDMEGKETQQAATTFPQARGLVGR